MSQRFFKFVKKTDSCWIWIGYKNHLGYGRFYDGKRAVAAHRTSWVIHNAKIPDKIGVLHKCDNPPCVNPDHLFLGTPKDNAEDRVKKGRQIRGEEVPNSILTTKQVLEIKNKYERNIYTQKTLASEYGVHIMTINSIVNETRWGHLFRSPAIQ